MDRRFVLFFVILAMAALSTAQTELPQTVRNSPQLHFQTSDLKVQPPQPGWRLGMVSWIAVDRQGLVYLLQRGDKADPIVVTDRNGRFVRSWGKGMFTLPHAIRIDPEGNVWTTDAATSVVYKFTPEGKKLLEIAVGGVPTPCRDVEQESSEAPSGFCGTTDIAFAPNGHLLIADGYANARVLEYSGEGKKLREWGSAGKGPGQFRLVHSIQVDPSGIVYVSDRENGRVERFDLNGKYLGEWPKLGRVFSIKCSQGAVWLAAQQLEAQKLTSGWLLKVDPKTGKLLGHVDIAGAHGLEARPELR